MRTIQWLFVACLFPLTVADAQGHAIGVEAKLSDGVVTVEAFFDDDTPAIRANVTVRDADKTSVGEGKTDDQGIWTFPAPKPGRYEVIVDGGDGHLARMKITIPGEAGAEDEGPRRVSDGPDRQEFTAFPWQGALAGCAFFAAIGAIAWLARRRKPIVDDEP